MEIQSKVLHGQHKAKGSRCITVYYKLLSRLDCQKKRLLDEYEREKTRNPLETPLWQ